MTVTLQVSDVRRECYRAAGGPASAGVGHPSTQLLGGLFHKVFSALLENGADRNLDAALAESEDDLVAWKTDLVEHIYRRLVGPELREHQSLLHDAGEQTLSFWNAVQEAADWLAELAWTTRQNPGSTSQSLIDWGRPDQLLSWELSEPGWTDSVRLVGEADVLFRVPDREPWCLVELKLGRTAPEADLAQACLYHQMLQAASESPGADQRLAVISFLPERHEKVYSSSELSQVQSRLKSLIARLAGVLPEAAQDGRKKKRPVSSHPTDSQIELGRKLLRTFQEYGAPVQLDGDPIVGPTFLRYPVVLGRGVKLASIKNRVEEVQMRLQMAKPPLVTMTRGQVAIDLQRPDRQYVMFSDIRDRLPEPDPLLGCSQVPVGVDLNGEMQLADLAETEHCHLLVAGTTGSGKSEWLRSALAGLLVTNTPETLKLVLIDPKRNAFYDLRESPFLKRPIVYPDEHSVPEVLADVVEEMDFRYAAMEGADSIAEHIRRTGKSIPRIVCVCDEYYDLINQGREQRRSLEEQIFRLGAKARAAGIHLILATQQPSREVVKGILDTNIPARVGLKTTNAVESRMLLGQAGAENLLGYGDLLFKDLGEPRRLQSAYVSPEERTRIFASDQLRTTG